MSQLKTSHPTHPYVLKIKAKEAEFDDLAAKYLQEVENPEDLKRIQEMNAAAAKK